MTWKDRICLKLAFWMSARIVYWCSIRLMTYNYGESPDNQTCTQALKRWESRL